MSCWLSGDTSAEGVADNELADGATVAPLAGAAESAELGEWWFVC